MLAWSAVSSTISVSHPEFSYPTLHVLQLCPAIRSSNFTNCTIVPQPCTYDGAPFKRQIMSKSLW